MNQCQNQLVCYKLYPSSACFCNFWEKKRRKSFSMYFLCWHNFQPRLIAFFFFFLLSVYSVYDILKVGMPKNVSQSKDAKKWPTDANFQAHASTGRKVEMAGANAGINAG